MKKIFMIAVTLILVFALAACGGGNGGGGGSGGDNDGSSGGGTAAPASATDDDPCPCWPDCGVAACEHSCNKAVCAKECKKDNGSYDCKKGKCCTSDDEAPPITYDIKMEMDLPDTECSFDECGMITSGTATVTMNYIDNKTGYFGSAEGAGKTLKNGSHETAVKNDMVPGDLPSFVFTAQLSVPGDGNTILLGVDRFSSDEVIWDFSAWGGGPERVPSMLQGTFSYLLQDPLPPDTGAISSDPGAGFVIFELPLTDGVIQKDFTWGSDFFVTITLTPVD